MKLNLHPEAAKNFNEKAEGLLLAIEKRPRPRQRRPEGPLEPDIHIAANILPEDIIGDVHTTLTDAFGNEIAKTFESDSELIGLFDDNHKKLIRIAEGMQKVKTLASVVSVELLSDLIFEWIKLKYGAAPVAPIAEYVLAECEKQIQETEIWVPVFMLHVQSDITVGRVTLKTITRAMLDEWRVGFFTHAKDDATISAVEQFITKQRGKLQGFAAATIRQVAEPRRASELAFEEAEQAVALLRFFSPANFNPRIISYCELLGRQHIDSAKYLTVRDGRIQEYFTGVLDHTEPAWPLSNVAIADIRSNGLDTLSHLLTKERHTDFQQELLAALQLYAKSSLAKDISDKLVYILVALESLFLRDGSEPIVDNISERMAFFAGSTIVERKGIISNVKKTYGLRSSYIHHGRRIDIDDLTILEEFMLTAWRCLQALIGYAASDSASKTAFLDELEERKLA
jgi:hypothetical protein